MTLSRTRAQTTRRMAGVEIPSAFASATIAAEARLLAVPAAERTEAQRRDLRRESRKALRLDSAVSS